MKGFHFFPIWLLILAVSMMMAAALDQLKATISQLQIASPPAPTAATQPATEKRIVAYTLPPDLYKKAHDRSRIHFRLDLIGFCLWAGANASRAVRGSGYTNLKSTARSKSVL